MTQLFIGKQEQKGKVMKMKKMLSVMGAVLMAVAAYAGDKPEFPGGDAALKEYLSSNLKYPQAAIDNGIEGVVDVAFMVLTDGSIGTIKIVRMVDPDLESEAIRLVKGMPAWIPADKNGKPVDAQTQVEVNFVLP